MNRLIVIGAVNVDITARSFEKLIMHDSNPGTVTSSFGGVGFNVLRNLHKLGLNPKFITGISDDIYGQKFLLYCKENGINIENSQIITDSSCGQYISIEDCDGEMITAVCESSILERVDRDKISDLLKDLDDNDIVVLDTNYSASQLESWIRSTRAEVYCDPISTAKAQRIRNCLDGITLLKPNRYEAESLCGFKCADTNDYPALASKLVAAGVRSAAITLGEDGVIYSDGLRTYHLPAFKTEVVSASGAGDGFISGMIYGRKKGYDIKESLKLATAMSLLALQSEESVDESLTEEKLLGKYEEIRNEVGLKEIVP